MLAKNWWSINYVIGKIYHVKFATCNQSAVSFVGDLFPSLLSKCNLRYILTIRGDNLNLVWFFICNFAVFLWSFMKLMRLVPLQFNQTCTRSDLTSSTSRLEMTSICCFDNESTKMLASELFLVSSSELNSRLNESRVQASLLPAILERSSSRLATDEKATIKSSLCPASSISLFSSSSPRSLSLARPLLSGSERLRFPPPMPFSWKDVLHGSGRSGRPIHDSWFVSDSRMSAQSHWSNGVLEITARESGALF